MFLFAETLEKMRLAGDEQDMFDIWNPAIESLGGNSRHYGCWNEVKGGDHISGFLLTTNYSDEWQNEYYEGGLIENDPILKHASEFALPFDWAECPINSPEEQAFMHIAAEAEGLRYGFSAALPTATGRHGAVSVASEHKWDVAQHMPTIYALTSALHMGVQFMQRERAANSFGLTKRELEILRWMRDGKTYAEIGMILGVGENTIRRQSQSAYRKLGVSSAVFAVTKAIFHGLIDL